MSGVPPNVATGARIGPYEIVAWLGTGGMGDVYRACDPRLGRDVAIKLIRGTFTTDRSRVQRFEQEARAAGQLNHPNILAVYDSGLHEEAPYIVSELLEGESLRTRLAGGALPMRKVIDFARQLAEGLGAAHDKGIVHRDLKPDNLFITNDGRIKILDFGIAKLTRPSDELARRDGAPIETELGMVVGTAGYMSPEQVRGEDVDSRSDLFSVGAILYEMLTGRTAFTRGNSAETMAAILKEDPPQPLSPGIPPALDRIVARCLEKTREARFQSARDLAFALGNLPATVTAATTGLTIRDFRRLAARPATLALAGVVVVGLALVVMRSTPRARVRSSAPVRLSAELSPGLSLEATHAQFGDAAILSPDGATIAFVAPGRDENTSQIYIRRLDQLHAEPLSGTQSANCLFFSADSQWIGFNSGGKLKKIDVTGGAAATLADAPELRGGSWANDDTIVFSPDKVAGTRLLRVSASGGKAEPLAELAEGELVQQWPQILPGGKAVLYTSSATRAVSNNADIVVQPLPGGTRKVVQRGGYHGRYLPSGHLVYIHEGTLFAVPFDLSRLEVTGPAVAALEGVRSNSITGGAQFSASDAGTFMYLPGPSVGGGIPIQWMGADAKTTPLRAALANWSGLSFAPDGRRLAMSIREGPSDIWVYELSRESLTRLTSDPAEDVAAVWSPDGRDIAFASARGDKLTMNIFWQRADGAGDAQRLTHSPNIQRPGSWHPSGTSLAFAETNSGTSSDVMILPLERNEAGGWNPGKPTAFANSPAMENEPVFSPDGRWLAYVSDESGRPEVYVRPFPGPGGKTRISIDGGFTPTWSRTKRELFYGFFDGRIRVAPYAVAGDAFVAEKPRLWSEGRYQSRGGSRMFDLHPDGDRFALAAATQTPGGARPDKVVFVFNFFDELRRLAPATKR